MISEQQKKILAFPFTDYRKYSAIICDGAIRSGKTSIMTYAFIKWAMDNFDHCRFGLCGKTVDSAIKNIVEPFMNLSIVKEMYQSITFRRSDKILRVKRGNAENIFEIFGGKDESSQNLIQGRTLAGILVDEVVLQPESFVNQAMARCSVTGSRLWFSCNPSSPSHWFHEKWIKKAKEKKALYLHFTLQDNPSLTEDVIERYENSYEGVFYDRFILGKWVNAEGIIYRQFANHTDMFLIEEPGTFMNTIAIGIDYGAGRSKTYMKAVGFDSGLKNVFVLDEYDKDGIFDPDTLYKRFHAFYKKVVEKYGKCQYVLADWGGLGNMLNEGLYVYCRKNAIPVRVEDCDKGTILDRIQLTQKLMAEHRLFIRRECKDMIKALSDALWDDKRPDTRLDDGTTDIDSLDAFEYAVYMFKDYLLKAVKYQ